MVEALVFPRLTQYSNRMELEPSPLIEEVPSLDNGGITEDPFTVTYHLNPKAIWSDGRPITCDDVTFTEVAMYDTTGNIFSPGYDSAYDEPGVSHIMCPDPRTVRLDFNKVSVDWPEEFGGAGGFILERAAFSNVPGYPDHPDLKDEMRDSIPFSGGPWRLIRWSKDLAVFVRNDKYWGHKTYFDQVTFLPRPVDEEAASLADRELDVIYQPRTAQTDTARSLRNVAHIAPVTGPSDWVEALWLNLDDPLLRSPTIRQAFAYAMDRDAVARGGPGLIERNAQPDDCGPWVPGRGPWCPSSGPFARYAYDPDKAISLLTRAGYDCSAVAHGGFCTKNGKPLTITISTTNGDVGRATAVSLLETGALAAGIDVQLRTYSSSDLFSNRLPQGRFQVALYRNPTGVAFYASSTSPIADPDVSSLFKSDQIPTQANGFGGGNFDHLRDRGLDLLLIRSDLDVDQARRVQDIQAVGRRLADDLPILPLYVMPNLAAWRTDVIAGVDPNDVSSPYGFFSGMASWYFAG